MGRKLRKLFLFASLLLFAAVPATALASDISGEYDLNLDVSESGVWNLDYTPTHESDSSNRPSLRATFRGSGGVSKLDKIGRSTVRWEVIPYGSGEFSFFGTVYVYKYQSGEYKYHSAFPANGAGFCGLGTSGQINLGLSKGSYKVTLYGTSMGSCGLHWVVSDASIGMHV